LAKILAFSGSSGSKSINQQLVKLAAAQLNPSQVTVIDIRDYPMPIFSTDLEETDGFPENATRLRALFTEHSGFLISMPEYNGLPPAIFKNTIDWISRMEGKIFQNKPVLLLSTSPGQRGGQTVLQNLATLLPRWGGNVVAAISIANFHDEFDASNQRLKSPQLHEILISSLRQLEQEVS